MATLTVGAGFHFDMTALDIGQLFDGVITHADSNLLQVEFSPFTANDFINFIGNFTYSGNINVYGTIEQIRDFTGGFLAYTITNMSVDAQAFQQMVIDGNSNGALNLVFGGNDILKGGALDDNLLGLGGNDTINGGAGNDILGGGSGNDRITGGTGNDTITTGKGQDTINFHSGFGNDVITDLKVGTTASLPHDTIELHSIAGLSNFAEVMANTTIVNNEVVITDAVGDSITLNNVQTVGQLHDFDFHFLA